MIEAMNTRPMNGDDCSGVAPETDDAIMFDTPSVCDGCAVRILAFQDRSSMERTREAFETFNRPGRPVWKIRSVDNLLIVFDGAWPDVRQRTYFDVLCQWRDDCPDE
jgi:hypothetical protein